MNTYTAWRDDGRENANYFVSYSPDGTNFSTLATVAYNPSPYPTKDGTGGTLTSLAVTNLTGVQCLQWNFSASQQNGGVGYTELAAFGRASASPVPLTVSVASWTGLTSFVLNVRGLSSGQRYLLQSTTNLAAVIWFTETNFVATQTVAAFTNSTTDCAQKFYRNRAESRHALPSMGAKFQRSLRLRSKQPATGRACARKNLQRQPGQRRKENQSVQTIFCRSQLLRDLHQTARRSDSLFLRAATAAALWDISADELHDIESSLADLQ